MKKNYYPIFMPSSSS